MKASVFTVVAFVSWFVLVGLCPVLGAEARHEIQFPNVPGYQTLKCDFHMHTVFSDGNVWPTVRVEEAWRLGLDAISITDHIEYQPHKDDVPTKFGRSHDLAQDAARSRGILLVKGAEITRETPPGHFNALFLKDIKPLDTPEFLDAVKQANLQGAFVFWNHQAWQGEEKGKWLDVHTTMFDKKWLHGMEVYNGDDYYPNAHRWSTEKNLTLLGNSDIHDPDLHAKFVSQDHRALTLVFVKERTLAGLKEALFAGRTVVWGKDRLVGRKEWLGPLVEASIVVAPAHHRTDKDVWVRVRNACDADIQLKRTGDLGPTTLELPAGSTSLVHVALPKPTATVELRYTAKNLWIAPATGLPVTLRIPAQ